MRANPPTRIFTYIYSKRPPRRGGRFGYSFNLLFRATGGFPPALPRGMVVPALTRLHYFEWDSI